MFKTEEMPLDNLARLIASAVMTGTLSKFAATNTGQLALTSFILVMISLQFNFATSTVYVFKRSAVFIQDSNSIAGVKFSHRFHNKIVIICRHLILNKAQQFRVYLIESSGLHGSWRTLHYKRQKQYSSEVMWDSQRSNCTCRAKKI